MQSVDALFLPTPVAGKILPSRVFLAPLNTGFALRGTPTDDLIRFHEARSGEEIGVSLVGNVAVSPDGAANLGTAVLDKDSCLDQYRRLANTIKSRGSLAGIQLAYSPYRDIARNWVVTQVDDERKRLSELLLDISDLRIERVLNEFIVAVGLSVEAGFDFIQIHAAHGYLLSLLLHPLTNKRSGPVRTVRTMASILHASSL